MKVFCTGDSDDEARAVKFYRLHGYAIFDHAFSSFDCDAVLAIYERHADDDYATILNLDREVLDIQERVVKCPTIVRLVEKLTDSEMVGCQTFFLFKKPGTRYANQEFNPHQDNSYPRAEPGAYLAVDIALTDQDAESGGIYLWPGTHRLGLLPFREATGYRESEGAKAGNAVILPSHVYLQGVNGETLAKLGSFCDSYEKVDVVLKKGQAMIFEGNLIHASYPNLSNRWRPAIITNYLRRDAEMVAGRTAKRLRIPLHD